MLRCQPPGVPRIGPPDKIVQTARELVFLYEDVSGPFFRIVPLRTGVTRIDDSESYLGDATGRWEGDTLVVETANFNDLTWLTDDGAFHTAGAEGHRVADAPRQRDRVPLPVADDPTVLAEPWQPAAAPHGADGYRNGRARALRGAGSVPYAGRHFYHSNPR